MRRYSEEASAAWAAGGDDAWAAADRNIHSIDSTKTIMMLIAREEAAVPAPAEKLVT
jgi:hypothetical protein